jgi:predicted metalloprotease with PDZ domain
MPQPYIEVSVGRHITNQALKDDWVLVHEMIHLALPAVADEQNWLAEGIATYVEGIARTQAGNMTEAALWQEYMEAMPRGLPQANDRGLDRTHTHARTYWGGALYCLIADVQIREQTNSLYGLQDALRAIRRTGAGMSAEWPIERILTTGDAATGTTVLRDLYMTMKDQPVAPDLDMLWTELGIRMRDGMVSFDDSARLAVVRRAITQ